MHFCYCFKGDGWCWNDYGMIILQYLFLWTWSARKACSMISINKDTYFYNLPALLREKINETVGNITMRNLSEITDRIPYLSAFRLLMYSIYGSLEKRRYFIFFNLFIIYLRNFHKLQFNICFQCTGKRWSGCTRFSITKIEKQLARSRDWFAI